MNTEEQDLSRLKQQRLEKLQTLEQEFSIDPYILNLQDKGKTESLQAWEEFKANRKKSTYITENYESLTDGEVKEDTLVWVAGRIHANRNSAMFIDLVDQYGKVQIVTDREDLEGDYQVGEKHFLDLLDKGDIIAVQGHPYRTGRGHLSIKAKQFWILSKALEPPPEIIEKKRRRLGITDVEVKYRQRYLDLMVNADVRETFMKRSKIISQIRQYLDNQEFLEFETPILQVEAGGANARPFTTHHNALDLDLYMRIATELHLKRLLVGGFERIYEIGRIFRNEGISTKHNPEFTSVEIYQAYGDYYDVLNLTRELIISVNQSVNGTDTIQYEEHEIDLSTANWQVKSMRDIVKEVTGLEPSNDELTEIFEEKCEHTLIQPTFVINHGWKESPLAGVCPRDDLYSLNEYAGTDKEKSEFAHRFELYITGREIANGFAEQNDPRRQRKAFEEQVAAKAAGDDEAHPLDEDFIQSLEYAMPPAGGVGIGIDRLVMLLTNSSSIRDVILFPTMKPQQA